MLAAVLQHGACCVAPPQLPPAAAACMSSRLSTRVWNASALPRACRGQHCALAMPQPRHVRASTSSSRLNASAITWSRVALRVLHYSRPSRCERQHRSPAVRVHNMGHSTMSLQRWQFLWSTADAAAHGDDTTASALRPLHWDTGVRRIWRI